MKTVDFFTSITSQKLKENFEKLYGSKINLNRYSREQLEDMRNKLRTRVFQQESTAGYNDLLTNETYQKDQALLKLLNTRIKEMLGEDIKKLRDKMDELSEAKKGVRAPKYIKHAKGSVGSGKDQTGDGKKDFDDVQVARMVAGGVPKKTAIAKATSDNFKEEMNKVGDTQKTRTGVMTKTATGVKHTRTDYSDDESGEVNKTHAKSKSAAEKAKQAPAQKQSKTGTWGMKDGEKFDNRNKSVKEGMPMVKGPDGKMVPKFAADGKGKKDLKKEAVGETDNLDERHHDCNHTPKGEKCPVHGMKECGTMEGRDEFGKGKNFSKIAKAAGGGEKGNRIAGAVRAEKIKKAGGNVKYAKESINVFKYNVRLVNESLRRMINEDEEGKAKAITAASDMVNDFTSWMQRVGQYQTKAIVELADAIKADFGAQEAETFKQSVAPALAATLETLTQQREAISNAVAVLAGEQAPMEPMGMEPAMGPEEPGMEPAEPDTMNAAPEGDEFGAAEGPGTSREVRESGEQKRARKLAEAHSIISKLAR